MKNTQQLKYLNSTNQPAVNVKNIFCVVFNSKGVCACCTAEVEMSGWDRQEKGSVRPPTVQ